MRTLHASVLALLLGSAAATPFAATAEAQLAIDIQVNVPPPPLPYYEQPVIPAEGYLWVPGFWAWDEAEADYYWVPGTWVEPPQPELLWTPAYWGWVGGRYAFHPGYWGREVGFYGGIDYGYGYGGDGYQGGRWDHGAFFYNRSVNNVESVRITNVYNQTVVVNRNSNVSFNGGNGGTVARPTAQQETIARERHVEPTPVQRQQVQTASKDRASFAKQNHGEPAVAATPRAGVFQGNGVSRGSRDPVAAKPGNTPAAAGPAKPGNAPAAAGPGTNPKAGERPSSGPATGTGRAAGQWADARRRAFEDRAAAPADGAAKGAGPTARPGAEGQRAQSSRAAESRGTPRFPAAARRRTAPASPAAGRAARRAAARCASCTAVRAAARRTRCAAARRAGRAAARNEAGPAAGPAGSGRQASRGRTQAGIGSGS